MKISAIIAMSRNGVIGKDGGLPWHLPEDLKRFRQLTTGHAIIMGRKTYDSLPKVLPGRFHIVISGKSGPLAPKKIDSGSLEESVQVVSSWAEAIETCKVRGEKEPFVIGGALIFKLALPFIDCLYLTEIHQDIAGDTVLELDSSEFNEISREDFATPIPFSFLVLQKKRR